jgi:hypothetical protein
MYDATFVYSYGMGIVYISCDTDYDNGLSTSGGITTAITTATLIAISIAIWFAINPEE